MTSLKYQQGFAITIALPWLAPLLTSILTFIFKKTVLSFLIITSIYILIEFLTPLLTRLAGSYFSTDLAALLGSFPAEVSWFLYAFRIDYGAKVLVAAMATRFLIRRIPFIG